VRFWIGGKVRRAKATVIPAGAAPLSTKGFSPAVRGLLPFLAPYALAGWSFVFLTPSPARPKPSASRSAAPRTRKGAAPPPPRPGRAM
jgi:hypothetical protein